MNEKIRIKDSQLLSDNHYVLKKYSIEQIDENGEKEIYHREVYDRGNGAVILLYHPKKKSVILTKQFRIPNLCEWKHRWNAYRSLRRSAG